MSSWRIQTFGGEQTSHGTMRNVSSIPSQVVAPRMNRVVTLSFRMRPSSETLPPYDEDRSDVNLNT